VSIAGRCRIALGDVRGALVSGDRRTVGEALDDLGREMGMPEDSAVLNYVKGFLAEEWGLSPDVLVANVAALEPGQHIVEARVPARGERVFLSRGKIAVLNQTLVSEWPVVVRSAVSGDTEGTT
jgi:hypothetical protein